MSDGTPSSPALLPRLQAMEKGVFCSISSDTTPEMSAQRAESIQGQHRALCMAVHDWGTRAGF